MIGDKDRELLASECLSKLEKRAIVNMSAKCIGIDKNPSNDTELKYTNFDYVFRYAPSQVKGSKKHYLIRSDLLPGLKIRLSGFPELLKEISNCCGLYFLYKWTNIKEERLWEIARMHAYTDFRIFFDFIGYEKKVKESFPQAGRNYPIFYDRKRAMEIARERDEYYKDVIKEGEKTIYDD